MAGQFVAAEARFDELRGFARSRIDRGDVANAQVKLYIVMGRYDDALRLGLAELGPFGEPLISTADDDERTGSLAAERERLSANLAGLDLRSIVDRPMITDPEPRALLALLTSMAPAVYSRRPSLFPLLAMRVVNLSLERALAGLTVSPLTLSDAQFDADDAAGRR